MSWTTTEILETLRMTEVEHLDIRTITMGISLRGLTGGDAASAAQRVYDRVSERAGSLIETVDRLSRHLGIPVANKRVAITPVAVAFDNLGRDGLVQIAQALDRAAANVGVDYIAGYSALVDKGSTRGDEDLMASIPEAIGGTERVCASVNVASSRAGINLDAVAAMGRVIKRLAEATRDRDAVGCAKLVVFCNVPEDNPFVEVEGARVETGNRYHHVFPVRRGVRLNYWWRVFRAESTTARLIVSDWQSEDEPGGPIGQELVYNFVEVQPYLED